MACGFTVHACLDLPAHETYGLSSADFHEVRKRTATLLHGMSATSDNANRNSFTPLRMTVTYDFHEIHTFSTNVCKELLYRISWKSDNGLATDKAQTDTTDGVFTWRTLFLLHKERLKYSKFYCSHLSGESRQKDLNQTTASQLISTA
jgi:hypothetical protein